MILTHVVAVSLTPLIPIPFADDIAATGFRRRLVRKLAEAHHTPLTEDAVRRLADRPSSGSMGGRILRYPIRRIFRKIFYVLEWKRALDTLGDDTLRAALLEHALASRAPIDAPRLAAAIDRTVAEADRGLFPRTARAALRQSTRLVKRAALLLTRSLRSRFTSTEPAAAERALDNLEDAGPSAIDQLSDLLDRIVESLPADYLPGLRARFDRELAA
jgi:hypothetical protein